MLEALLKTTKRRRLMQIPSANTDGCDVALWRDADGEFYWLWTGSLKVVTKLEGDLASFITHFPAHLRLCIMNDQTGKFVKILPVAN